MKFNSSNFRYIMNNLTLESANMYFDAVIMSHMSCCLTTWASANRTTLKPFKLVCKQAVKV